MNHNNGNDDYCGGGDIRDKDGNGDYKKKVNLHFSIHFIRGTSYKFLINMQMINNLYSVQLGTVPRCRRKRDSIERKWDRRHPAQLLSFRGHISHTLMQFLGRNSILFKSFFFSSLSDFTIVIIYFSFG